MRKPREQRDALAATIRSTAEWRWSKAEQFSDDDRARKACQRAAHALRSLAGFVECLPDSDPDLALPALRKVGTLGGRLCFAPDASLELSRFGIGKGSWQAGEQTEVQMRNVLRRIDGIEARKRGERAARRRGEGRA